MILGKKEGSRSPRRLALTPEGSIRHVAEGADQALNTVRFVGDLVVAAFFAEDDEKPAGVE
jgi:hypothetical protein